MEIQTHIIDTIPVFKVDDLMSKVIQFFNNSTFCHIAVVEDNKFLGLLSENDMENYEQDKIVNDYRYDLESFSVKKDTSWLDVLEVFARNESNLVPVLDEDHFVIGYYDLTDIVSVFIATPFFTEPGGILVISKGIKDYSFSEIAQIVETNNAKLVGGFITGMQNDMVEITIKISPTNLNDVIQTFRRYSYEIILGTKDDMFIEDLKERSNYLTKYLNV